MGHTLNSRLRVLVAKTFRAEKLYSSIRNSRSEKLANLSSLSEMANDMRAKEWQRSHFQLRTSLNDILSLGSNSAVAAELVELKERFHEKAEESEHAVEKGTEALIETAKRQEFAHIFRLSVELIRYKARAQANGVIAEELRALLDASGRLSESSADTKQQRMAAFGGGLVDFEPEEEPLPTPSNVIPLRRKAGRGRR